MKYRHGVILVLSMRTLYRLVLASTGCKDRYGRADPQLHLEIADRHIQLLMDSIEDLPP